MKDPKSVTKQRLKRKRLIASRLKCHDSKDSCLRVHPIKTKPKVIEKIKKENWWKRLLKFFKII